MFSIQRVIASGLFLLLFSATLAAQDDPCLHRTVAVNVFDAAGKLVSGLTPQDFRAEMDGKSVQILSANFDNSPHRVVVVLDSSASMFANEHSWPVAKAFAANILAVAPGHFQTGLIVFNDQVRIKLPVQDDPGPAQQALADLPSHPNKKDQRTGRTTALLDALMTGADLLEPSRFGDSIYAITDGGENRSESTIKALRTRLLLRGVRLNVELLFPEGEVARATIEEVMGPDDLVNLVKDSGGFIAQVNPKRFALASSGDLDSKDAQQVRSAAEGFYAAIRFPYRLDLILPAPVQKPEKWKLLVRESKSQRVPFVLGYSNRLAGCLAGSPATQ